MDAGLADLPDDVATLKAMVIAGREREARMQHLIDQMKRAQFGPRSEKLSPDQLALALDDLDVARAELTALGEQADDADVRIGRKRIRKTANAARCRGICRASRSSSRRLRPNARAVVARFT